MALMAFTFFQYGKRAAMKSNTNNTTWSKAELGTEQPKSVNPGPLGELDGSGGGVAELAGREGRIAELEATKKGDGAVEVG